MLIKKYYSFTVVVILILCSSCQILYNPDQSELAPKIVRVAALTYAKEYVSLGAVYEWGGQDPLPRTIKVDCSGLVIRCYEYACSDHGYSLPFNDMNAIGIKDYCDSVNPEPGDLIFMGDNNVISHVAIYEKTEDQRIYFIDSTTITGVVSERSYSADSSKFISFGRIHLYKE